MDKLFAGHEESTQEWMSVKLGGEVVIVLCRPTGSDVLFSDSMMIATTVTNAKE